MNIKEDPEARVCRQKIKKIIYLRILPPIDSHIELIYLISADAVN